MLWLWVLDREFAKGSFDLSLFARNYDRMLFADVAKLFFLEVYGLGRKGGWTSDDHFTANAHWQLREGVKIQTLGADNGNQQKDFVQGFRERGIEPHMACKDQVQVRGLDGCNTTQTGYQFSLKTHKRVEEIFNWIKTVRTECCAFREPQVWITPPVRTALSTVPMLDLGKNSVKKYTAEKSTVSHAACQAGELWLQFIFSKLQSQ